MVRREKAKAHVRKQEITSFLSCAINKVGRRTPRVLVKAKTLFPPVRDCSRSGFDSVAEARNTGEIYDLCVDAMYGMTYTAKTMPNKPPARVYQLRGETAGQYGQGLSLAYFGG